MKYEKDLVKVNVDFNVLNIDRSHSRSFARFGSAAQRAGHLGAACDVSPRSWQLGQPAGACWCAAGAAARAVRAVRNSAGLRGWGKRGKTTTTYSIKDVEAGLLEGLKILDGFGVLWLCSCYAVVLHIEMGCPLTLTTPFVRVTPL